MGMVRGILWILRPPNREPPEPTVSPEQLAILKEIGRAPQPPVRQRQWFKNRPGWFGPTANERLLESVGRGYSEIIKAATDIHLTPQEKIRLARQAFAQDAITIDELERIIENAIKDQA